MQTLHCRGLIYAIAELALHAALRNALMHASHGNDRRLSSTLGPHGVNVRQIDVKCGPEASPSEVANQCTCSRIPPSRIGKVRGLLQESSSFELETFNALFEARTQLPSPITRAGAAWINVIL